MTCLRYWRFWVWTLYLSYALSTASVRADDVEDARVLFNAGGSASAAQHFEEARDYFQRSAALVPKATTYLNLAVVEIRLGLGREALTTLDQFERVATPAEHGQMIERARTLRSLAQEVAEKQSTALPTPPNEISSTEESAQPALTEDAAGNPIETMRIMPAEPPARSPWSASWIVPTSMFAGAALAVYATYVSNEWRHTRADALQACLDPEPQCVNREGLEREERAALSITLVSGAAALGLASAGIWWLVKHKKPAALHGMTPGPLGVSVRF